MPDFIQKQEQFLAALQGNASIDFADQFTHPREQTGVRLSAYERNMRATWRRALIAAYPVIETLIGPNALKALAHAYTQVYPSQNGDLHHYSAHFADFLKQHPIHADLPYLTEIAELEWALETLERAPDLPIPDFYSLTGLSLDQLSQATLILPSDAHLIHCQYPIADIWHAHQLEDEEKRDAILGGLPMSATAQAVLVFKKKKRPWVIGLSAGEQALWEALSQKITFASALQHALDIEPSLSIHSLIQNWFHDNLIRGITETKNDRIHHV